MFEGRYELQSLRLSFCTREDELQAGHAEVGQSVRGPSAVAAGLVRWPVPASPGGGASVPLLEQEGAVDVSAEQSGVEIGKSRFCPLASTFYLMIIYFTFI